jgi:hypothetical protein
MLDILSGNDDDDGGTDELSMTEFASLMH